VSGTNGIVVQAGPSDVVILRNLRFNGIGTGINGIRFLSGRDLNVENCYIFGFTTNGIDVALNQATAASVHVLNSVIKNNGGVGIRATNAVSPQVQVGVNQTSIILDNIGIEAADHTRVIVNESFIENATSDGIKADSPSGDAIVTVDHTDISLGGNGVTTTTGSQINIGDDKIAFNSGVACHVVGGVIQTYGTNRIHNNGGGQGTCTAASPGQQ
jgi:hypothetical protein